MPQGGEVMMSGRNDLHEARVFGLAAEVVARVVEVVVVVVVVVVVEVVVVVVVVVVAVVAVDVVVAVVVVVVVVGVVVVGVVVVVVVGVAVDVVSVFTPERTLPASISRAALSSRPSWTSLYASQYVWDIFRGPF
jgi:hypothetical protein